MRHSWLRALSLVLISGLVHAPTARGGRVKGDLDGDGVADLAVFRRRTGTIKMARSSFRGANPLNDIESWGTKTTRFGNAAGRPAIGQYDGDDDGNDALGHAPPGRHGIPPERTLPVFRPTGSILSVGLAAVKRHRCELKGGNLNNSSLVAPQPPPQPLGAAPRSPRRRVAPHRRHGSPV